MRGVAWAAASVALKNSQRLPRRSRLHVGRPSFGRRECIVSSVFLLSSAPYRLEPLVPGASTKFRGFPAGLACGTPDQTGRPAVTLLAYPAGNLGGPPEPRTA